MEGPGGKYYKIEIDSPIFLGGREKKGGGRNFTIGLDKSWMGKFAIGWKKGGGDEYKRFPPPNYMAKKAKKMGMGTKRLVYRWDVHEGKNGGGSGCCKNINSIGIFDAPKS